MFMQDVWKRRASTGWTALATSVGMGALLLYITHMDLGTSFLGAMMAFFLVMWQGTDRLMFELADELQAERIGRRSERL